MHKNNVALNIIIQRYLPWISAIASKFPTSCVSDQEDYVSVGTIALIRAFKNYDKKHGTAWKRYLFVCIRNAISREANRFVGAFTLSDWEMDRRFEVSKIIQSPNITYEQAEAIASKLSISPKVLKSLLTIVKPITAQLEAVTIETKTDISIKVDEFKFLTEHERTIVKGTLQEKSLQLIGQELNISPETVRRWRAKAFEEISRRYDFDDFLK